MYDLPPRRRISLILVKLGPAHSVQRPTRANQGLGLTHRVKQSTGHTHTGHTDRENTPDTGPHTRTTRPPNEHLAQALNNAQRWRDDGACHLPRPGGWPRRSQHERYGRSATRPGARNSRVQVPRLESSSATRQGNRRVWKTHPDIYIYIY